MDSRKVKTMAHMTCTLSPTLETAVIQAELFLGSTASRRGGWRGSPGPFDVFAGADER